MVRVRVIIKTLRFGTPTNQRECKKGDELELPEDEAQDLIKKKLVVPAVEFLPGDKDAMVSDIRKENEALKKQLEEAKQEIGKLSAELVKKDLAIQGLNARKK